MNVLRELASEAFCKSAAITREGEAERAAKDNTVWFELDGLRDEAEEHSLDNVVPGFAVGDFTNQFAITGANGARGGEIFPFVFFAVIEVFFVARFEVAIFVR